MKKIYLMLMAFVAVSLLGVSCKEDEPFSTITEDDYPKILDPVFPDWVDGEPAVVSQITHDANFTMKLTVTPSDYTEVTWLIDGVEVQKGNEIDIPLEAGTYSLKVVATTTKGQSTSREGKIVVSPLQGEPWSEAVGFERIVSNGARARLYGNNLSLVTGVVIGEQTVPIVSMGSSDLGNYVEYEVPSNLEVGEYRISLVDVEGNSYGGNLVTVVNVPVITGGFAHATSHSEWVMTGIGLDKIVSLSINGTTVTEFIRQSYDEIVLTCPELEDGMYVLKGESDNGAEVLFYSSQKMESEISFAVSSETLLWEGHHYVSWDLPDGDPHKTFNLIPLETFESIYPGTTMYVSYSIKADDEYHQIRLTHAAWEPYFTDPIDVQEDGVYEFVLTQEILNTIEEKGGFICVGHGYYVDRITIK